MQSDSGIVHECSPSARCTVHSLEGNRAVPCSGGAALYTIPAKEFQSLGQLTMDFEGHLIASALRRAKGLKIVAADLLGCTRQGLNYMLNGRHKALRPLVVDVPQGRNGRVGRRKASE